MTNTKVKTILLGVFLLITSSIISQRRDTTYTYHILVDSGITLELNMEHVNINIIESDNDSITIETSVSIIPSHPKTPYDGIVQRTEQTNDSKIYSTLTFGENIQPSNALKAYCNIAIPSNTNLVLNNRYAALNMQTLTGKITADFEYVTFNNGVLNSKISHDINANYSIINLKELNNHLKLKGSNITFHAESVKKMTCDTKFSTINIEDVECLTSKSYTDKYIINSVDSFSINGEYSSSQINQLVSFFQGEMTYGNLELKSISATFKTINIANSYVNTSLSFEKDTEFTINADMRYCKLTQDFMTLEQIASPKGELFKRNQVSSNNYTQTVSLISNFGDVKMLISDN